ncbi:MULTISPECIES: triacylglycerol lipase [unclassified Amycolatopsis]|uniref:esterase/lipase family protein n=1 Tax=unclassified Amycolatopsis TaxID=2618356 RepID=UPI00106E0701|nr:MULTISPECIES: lipase [unclassified Amycolatopsis]
MAPLAVVLAAALAFSVPGHATAAGQGGYAPVDQPGPALTVPESTVDDALSCSPSVRGAKQDPVLLIPGTASNPESVFGWNFLPAFKAEGVPYCAVTLPKDADGDIQTAAEYAVRAIRVMHAESGRKVQILGWSQGAGPVPRWALRWWPDVRPMVNGLIAIDPPNHGSIVANALGCGLVNALCPPAVWQQRVGSKFLDALNSGAMTFPEVQYTVIYTRIDTINEPNIAGQASMLPAAPNVRNIALQDVCLSAAVLGADHGQTLGSAVTYQLVEDALRHPDEPANPSRVDRKICSQLGQPYSNPIAQVSGITNLYANGVVVNLPRDAVDAEPPLRCYVYPRGCGAN